MATQQQPSRDGKHGAPRLLVAAGLAVAVIGLSGFLFFFIGVFADLLGMQVQTTRAFGWLNGNVVFALFFGGTLAACLVGLVLGVIGWVLARRRGTSTAVPRLTVLLSLIGPIGTLVIQFVGLALFVSSGTGPN